MRYDIILRNGTIVTSRGRYAADIAICDGRIMEIAAPGVLPEASGPSQDLGNCFILPGLIDAHVHFRDPGLTHKEDLQTGTRSALYGGITYVVDMPNVEPVTSTAERLRERIALAQRRSEIDIGFFALLTGDNLDEMEGLREEGAVGYKVYLGTSVGNIAAPPDGILLEQFRRAASLHMRIGFHAENNAINDYCTQRAINSGNCDAAILPKARPDFSEVEAVDRAIAFSRETGAAIHIYHVSSAKTVARIRQAKIEGLDITCETCPHYLLLDESDYVRLGAKLKVFPPIRTRYDQDALWQGVDDGTIDMIATDHAPHTPAEKSGNIWEAMAGVAGVEISARLMLNEVHRGRLTLEKLCALMSEGPAKVWNLPDRGVIRPGAKANLTIIDPEYRGTIHDAALHGKTNVTAFDGTETVGAPVFSVTNGKLHKLV